MASFMEDLPSFSPVPSGFRRSKPNHLPVNKCIGLVGFLLRRHFLYAKGNILEGSPGPQGVILHLKPLRLHQRMHQCPITLSYLSRGSNGRSGLVFCL